MINNLNVIRCVIVDHILIFIVETMEENVGDFVMNKMSIQYYYQVLRKKRVFFLKNKFK